jgi:uncharacterized protein (DUF983 family)
MVKCSNCEQPIGNLETPKIFKDTKVCHACYKRLNWEDKKDDYVGLVIGISLLLIILLGAFIYYQKTRPTPVEKATTDFIKMFK